jgi:quercetin dioxygenase-like cupin family protein
MRSVKRTEAEIKDVTFTRLTAFERKLWGYERVLVNHKLYCGKILTVLPNGNACSLHYHAKKHETFHVIRGELFVQTLREASGKLESYILAAGATLVLPPRVAHRFWANKEVCDFVETSTHDDPKDSIRLVKSGPIPKSLVSLEGGWATRKWRK